MRRAVAVAFLAAALTACSEPLQFADWTIPVPEGTRIVEYAHVPFEERTERIEVVEDLVIGGDKVVVTDSATARFNFWSLGADPVSGEQVVRRYKLVTPFE